MPQKNIPFIDGCRALAALWVLVAHCAVWGAWGGAFIPNAKMAVDLFMMISGYLMAVHAFGRTVHGEAPFEQPSSWGRFYLRRFFRIAPAYWASLALAVVLAPIFLGGYAVLRHLDPAAWQWPGTELYDPQSIHYTAKNLFLHLSFLFGLSPSYTFSTFLPDWSLSLEMQFYAAFPLIFWAMQGRRTLAVALGIAGLCLPLALWLDAMPGLYGSKGLFIEASFLPLKIQYFVIGILVAHLDQGKLSGRSQALAWALCLLLSVSQPRHYGQQTLFLLAITTALLLLTARWKLAQRFRRGVDSLCSSPWVQFLSDTSYSLYLFHGFLIAFAGWYLFQRPYFAGLSGMARTLILLPIVLVGSYAMAYASFRCIETPGIQLGKRALRWLERSDQP